MKYNFEDINIGYDVIFDLTLSQYNHDLYWKVIRMDEVTKKIIIKLNGMGFTYLRKSINVDEVICHIAFGKI